MDENTGFAGSGGQVMHELYFLRRIGILLLSSCFLTACQMPAESIALNERSGDGKPVALPRGKEVSVPAPKVVSPTSRPQAASTFLGKPNGGSLTMEAAVRRALEWHPAIDEANGQIFRSQERIRAAQAGYYPKVNAGVNSGYQSSDREGWRPQFEVSASQMLYDFGKVSSSVDTQVAGRKITEAQLLLAVDDLARDTANAVIEVQRYRELTRLSEAQVAGVKAIAALVRERTDQGASTMSDRVQADARVESAVATQLQYQSEYSRWQVALASLIGGGRTNADPVPGAPDWLSRSCDVAAPDWTEVPAMLEAEAKKEEAAAQLAASKAEAFPTISLEAGTGYDLNARRDNTTDNDRQPEYSIGLNVSSTLYNGGQTGANKRAAAYALQSAEAAISAARLDTQRSLLESRSQIGALNRLTSSLAARAEMMVKTRDLYREQYLSLGTRTLLDLLNAEQELHDSRFQIANTVHDVRRLDVSCLYSSGKMRQSFRLNPALLRGGAVSQ